MSLTRQHARLFWAVAAFLLLAGQLAHAYLNVGGSSCAAMHQAQHSSQDDGEHDESSAVPEHCCHSHAPALGGTLPATALCRPRVVCKMISVGDQSVPEPPVREIDHPPQLVS